MVLPRHLFPRIGADEGRTTRLNGFIDSSIHGGEDAMNIRRAAVSRNNTFGKGGWEWGLRPTR
jgi:hypothetical protein